MKTIDAGALLADELLLVPQAEARPRARERPVPMFERAVSRRTHDVAALAAALLLVASLLGIGAWMTLEIAEGLALARLCDGQCVQVGQ